MLGDHNLGEFVATQVPISISSGESEFYGIVRAAVEPKFLNNLMTWLNFDEKQDTPKLVSDAMGDAGHPALGAVPVSHLFTDADEGGKLRRRESPRPARLHTLHTCRKERSALPAAGKRQSPGDPPHYARCAACLRRSRR